MKLKIAYLSALLALTTAATSATLPAPSVGKDSGRANPHGAQSTGNWKGKRDDHQKPGPQNEKKKKSPRWLSNGNK